MNFFRFSLLIGFVLLNAWAASADWLVRSSTAESDEELATLGLKRVHAYRHFPWAVYRGAPASEEKFARHALARSRKAHRNHTIRLASEPNDPYWMQQQHYFSAPIPEVDIRLKEAWDIQRDATSVTVAVIDSGIETTHTELAPNLWINPGEIAANGLDDDQNGFIDDVNGWNAFGGNADVTDSLGHGTRVAGLIAAKGDNGAGMSGICWSGRILPVRCFNTQNTELSVILTGIDYALSVPGLRIINASWVDPNDSDAMRDAFVAVEQAGILVIGSAGNTYENVDLEPVYPLGYGLANFIAVAAVSPAGELASFSNYGMSVLLAAPGESLLTTTPGNQFMMVSGTSFSAPVVTGAAALLLEGEPWLQPAQVVERFRDSSRWTVPLMREILGSGLLDVRALLSSPPPASAGEWASYQ